MDATIVKEDQKSTPWDKPINEKACDKLGDELSKVRDNAKPYATPIINYLIERCMEDTGMAEDVMQDHKTWGKCFEFIKTKARKKAVAGCACIEDQVVYEWAEDYYHKDDKAEEEKKTQKEAKAKKKAEAKKKAADAKKIDIENRALTGLEHPDIKEKVKAEKAALQKEKQPPAKKEDPEQLEGQMDIFQWLGGQQA